MIVFCLLPTYQVFTDDTPLVADKIERFVKLIGCDSIAAPSAKTIYICMCVCVSNYAKF